MKEQEKSTVLKLMTTISKYLAPQKSYTVSEYAEKYRILSQETSSSSGKWKSVGYQVAMMNAVGPRKTVVFLTATQTGKTELVKSILLKTITSESGGNTLLLPSSSMAIDYSKSQLETMIRDNPQLRNLIPSARKAGNSQLFRKWEGGFLRLVGSNSADKLSAFPSAFNFVDEVDRCCTSARNSAGIMEGSPIDLLFERGKNYPNGFFLLASTPTIKDVSVIFQWWLKSNQQIPLMPCPHCENKVYFDFFSIFNRSEEWGHFVWDGKDDDGKKVDIDTIAFCCGQCKLTFTENDYDRYQEPEWLALNPTSKIEGFHVNAFFSPWCSWKSLLEKTLKAGTDPVKLMTLWNTTGGWPYSFEAISTPDWSKLASRDHTYSRYEVPDVCNILLAACDVQQDRLECSVFAVFEKQFFLITHEIFSGNVANIDDECWNDLNEFIKRVWKKKNGAPILIHKCAIDAHYLTNTVAQFVKIRPKFVPVTGIDNNWSADVMPSKPMMLKMNGTWMRSGKRRWPIGVSVIKMDLYNRLKLQILDNGKIPSEYIHFPKGMPDEYYKQLTGEVCKLTETSNGFKQSWIKSYGDVETLDCAVYTLALYKICGLHLKTKAKAA